MLLAKTSNVILSCETLEQLEVARKYATLAVRKIFKASKSTTLCGLIQSYYEYIVINRELMNFIDDRMKYLLGVKNEVSAI